MRADAPLEIREATVDDWPAIWPFFAHIVREGETYTYPQDTTDHQGRSLWFPGQPWRTVLAMQDDVVVGTALMGPNRAGAGEHIATGSFMVDPAAAGRGIGRALGEELVSWARRAGYRGIQFNAVVETNAAAVHLWEGLGFAIVGTVPGAFRHPEHGYVALHVMFRSLVADPSAA